MDKKSKVLNIKKENVEELFTMFKDYIEVYFKSLLLNRNGYNSRKDLRKHILDYYLIIKEENSYIKFISDNYDKIKNKETLLDILDDLDLINEKTYNYYQHILSECDDLIYKKSDLGINTKKKFETIIETTRYKEEIKGLFLNEQDLYNYYQHEDAYYYLNEHNKVLDTSIERGMPFFGCFPKKENGIINEISLCTPKINDLSTMLINIHEFKHGIALYPYLGKNLPKYDLELEAKCEEEKFIKTYLLKK